MKNKIFVISAISLFTISGIIIYNFTSEYEDSLKKGQWEWYGREVIAKSFEGKITKIMFVSKDKVKVNLSIKSNKREEIFYAGICTDTSFLSFTKRQDSVFKEAGSNVVTVIKKDGREYRLILDFCDMEVIVE